jgi:hypothetical protein
MHFLIGAAIVLGFFYFLVVSPDFRKATAILGAVVVATVVAGILLLVSIVYKQNQNEKQESLAESGSRYVPAYMHDTSENAAFNPVTAIKQADLGMTDVNLIKQDNGEWILKGTIANNSDFDLTSLAFLVTIQDCPERQSCKTIGQERAGTVDRYIVPAHQVRLFNSGLIRFLNMPPAVRPRWEYKITQITASEPNFYDSYKDFVKP